MIVFVYLFLISNGGIDHLYITRLRNELVNGGEFREYLYTIIDLDLLKYNKWKTQMK